MAFSFYLPSVPVQSRPQDADQHERADGFAATDGSTRPAGPTRPAVSAGQPTYGQGRTGTDRGLPDKWPEGTLGAERNAPEQRCALCGQQGTSNPCPVCARYA